MTFSTIQIAKTGNDRDCKRYGVDKFNAVEKYEQANPNQKRTECYISFSLFGFKHYSYKEKCFFDWNFTWTKDNYDRSVLIPPIIKEIIDKKDPKVISYVLDYKEMEKHLIEAIKEGDRRGKEKNRRNKMPKTIKEEMQPTLEKYKIAKRKAHAKICDAIDDIMTSFVKETGFCITKININLLSHYHGSDCDLSIISSVEIGTNFKG